MFNVEQIFSSPCVVWWGWKSLWCWNSALDERKGPCRVSLEAQGPVGLDLLLLQPISTSPLFCDSACKSAMSTLWEWLWFPTQQKDAPGGESRVAVPAPWSTAEESSAQREDRRCRDGQVSCWQMAAAVGSAQVPGPEPGLALVPGACGLQRGGWQELHWLCQQRWCSASACASGVLGFPKDGQGPYRVFKLMPTVPLPKERRGTSVSCLISSKTQTNKNRGDLVRTRNPWFRQFWIPRDSCCIFKWIQHRLRGLEAELVWEERSQELLCPAVSVLWAWHSSSSGAPPWCSGWVILQLPCIPVVINGTPGAK